MENEPPTPRDSKEACKQHCKETDGCVYFTFYEAEGNCHLQDALASRVVLPDAHAGRVNCVESIPVTTSPTTAATTSPTTAAATTTPATAAPVVVQPIQVATESMPGNLPAVMRIGSVNAGLNGLSFKPSPGS